MVLQIFPEPSASALNADSYTVPEALRRYKIVKNFDAAVYTITTSPPTSDATITFFNSSSTLSTSTVSGTITYNLATAATGAFVHINTSTNIVVTINKVAAAISGTELSGTVDTITSTSTYNQTGQLYVLAVGAGGGGGGSYSGNAWNYGGWGGGYGFQTGSTIIANGPTSVTIGAQGNGGNYASAGNAGGSTTFGNTITALGGQPGDYASGGGGTGGRGGSSGSNGQAGPVATSVAHPTITNGTNGGGGGGWSQTNNNTVNVGQTGAGSGIGTGGTGGGYSGNAQVAGSAATGYGAGGGGGGSKGSFPDPYSGAPGGAGSPGVVYVLRGF